MPDEAPLRACPLPELQLLQVSGPDRATFLQGQLTQDVGAVSPATSAPYGWANAQGRLLATGQLIATQDAFWLTVPAALAEAVARRLRMFVLRARVEIAPSARVLRGLITASPAPLALGGAALAPAPLACAAGAGWLATRVAGDPARVLFAVEPGTPDPLAGLPVATDAGPEAWRLADVRAGIATLSPATADAYVPQMLNLDLAGGIAFAKGCYAGQEVITRTRHRGRVKRRMLRFAAPPGALPEPGATVHGTEGEIGRVIAAAATPAGAEWLAVVQLEEAARGAFADADRTRPLRRLPLPYAIPAE